MPLHLPAQKELTICMMPAAINKKPRALTDASEG